MDPATGAIGSLLPKLDELLRDKLQKSVRKEVLLLKDGLTIIQLALRAVEDVPVDQLNVQIKEWTRQARDLSYGIEHVVDKFLARRLRAADPPAADPNELIAKISFKVAIAKASRQFASDLRSFRHPTMELAKRRDRDTIAVPRCSMAADELIGPDGQVDELVGLDGRVEELVKILTEEEGGTSNRQLKVASILGPAGVGKTTLANQVYQRLNPRFECTAWVTVSPKPDIKNVLWTMLCQISLQDDANFGSLNVEETIGEIGKALKDKRYFIVVEDMWGIKAWEIIKCALIKNSNGSAVLMTSRKVSSVARYAGVVTYRLRRLSEISSRKLFHKRLFGSGDNCPPELADISEKILEKCRGIPSAIINAANLLAGKSKTTEDWHTVLESNGKRSRYLSYTGVPHHLKSCLLYLSMFQKEISVDRLVWGWIAEGLIPEHAGRTPQQLGEEYLSELMERKLIEAGGKALSCRVNSMGRDLIASLSAEENSVTILNGRQSRPLPQTVGRLAIQGNNVDLPQVRLSNVRSLVVSGDADLFSEESGGANLMSSLSKFENLRVLELGGCDSLQNDHLKDIGSLLLLRYLVIGGNCITNIPKDIGYLVFLQTLDLRATSVKELPDSIVRARQLKCLRVNRRTKIPHGIGKMKALEELGDMNISKPELLEELRHLTDLRVLRIVIWSWDDSYDDALLGYLGSPSMQNIESLSILTCCSLHFLDELDAGQAPPSLKKLEIRHSTFLELPGWICTLENLSSLSIEVYKLSQEIIDILGQLQNLLVLSLTTKHAPEGNFNNGFRNLTSFHFVGNAVGKIFGPGAMLHLKRLDLSFQASRTKDVFNGFDFGLENLSSLEHVHVEIICFNASLWVVEDATGAVRKAIYKGRSRAANLGIKRVQEEEMLENEKEEDMIDSEKGQEGSVAGNRVQSHSSDSSGSVQTPGGVAAQTSGGVVSKQAADKGSDGQKGSASGGDAGIAKQYACYRCNDPGHLAKDCKAVLFCINCGKDTHLSEKCSMLTMPKGVVKLVGCANDGLQMLVAHSGRKLDKEKPSGRKLDKEKPKQDMGLVTVLVGSLTAQQLGEAFSMQFPWGGAWKVKDYGHGSFLVKFPSMSRLEEMSEYPHFGLKGSQNVIKVSKWTSASVAHFKLFSVWVRVTGVPESMLHREGFDEIGSMLGVVQDIDMKMFWSHEIIRLKVGVRDPGRIPEVAKVTEDPFIYHVYFHIESIAEVGGPLVDGILVQQENREQNKHCKDMEEDREHKRMRNFPEGGNSNASGSSSKVTAVCEQIQDLEGANVDMVLSSQLELDKQVEENLRRMILLKKAQAMQVDKISGPSGVAGTNVKFAQDAVMLDRLQCSATNNEERVGVEGNLGLSTQIIARVNRSVNSDGSENVVPIAEHGKDDEAVISHPFLSGEGTIQGGDKEEMGRVTKDQGKQKDVVVDEARRSGRTNNEANAMDKAVDRSKYKNLEVGAEERVTKQATHRGQAVGAGSI